jgi:hypothetical protein
MRGLTPNAAGATPPDRARLADFTLAMYLPTTGITTLSSGFPTLSLASWPHWGVGRRNTGAISGPTSAIRRENGLGIAINLGA